MKQFGAWRLDTRNQCLWRDGVLLSVPPKPYAVLQYLVEHPDRLVTHDELMEALWPETYVQPQVLRTYVLDLRKLLGDDAANPRFIATIPKRGYRFLALVTDISLTTSERANIAAGTKPTHPNLHGREEELLQLHSLMQSVCEGNRQIVFVSGGAGIGKTALLDAFCACGCADGLVARGQSVEQFSGKEPYYPIKELLNELCGSEKGEKTQRLLARIAPGWVGMLAPRDPPQQRRDNVTSPNQPAKPAPAAAQSFQPNGTPAKEPALGEICEALEAIARESPLLLAFEDLQWADEATLDLVAALARRRNPAKLMVLATCRQDAAGGEPAKQSQHLLRTLKHDLAMRRLCTVITLPPLSKSAAAEYAAAELGRRHPAAPASTLGNEHQDPLPAGLGAFLHQQSHGNPLFLLAVLDRLLSQRTLKPTPRGWTLSAPLAQLDPGVPDTLRDMIDLELEVLTAADGKFLEAASVAGGVFPVWAVAAALAIDPQLAEEQCDALAQRVHIVRRAGHDELPNGATSTSYVFAHPFYRQVLYQRQSQVRRARGHERIAQALTRIFAGDRTSVAAEIASHYEAAGHWARAAELLAAMAEEAATRQDAVAAATLLGRALALLEHLGDRERAPLERELRNRIDAISKPAPAQPPALNTKQHKRPGPMPASVARRGEPAPKTPVGK